MYLRTVCLKSVKFVFFSQNKYDRMNAYGLNMTEFLYSKHEQYIRE